MELKIYFGHINRANLPDGGIVPIGKPETFMTFWDTPETLFHEILHWFRQLESLENPKTKMEIEDFTERFTLKFFPILEGVINGDEEEKGIGWSTKVHE